MSINSFTLGKSIAYLSYVIKSKQDTKSLIGPDNAMQLQNLIHVHACMQDNAGEARLSIPDHSCAAQEPFLLGNERFFIAHLLFDSLNKTDHHHLIKHLNDCHACFQIYCQFFKDYCQACQEISHSKGG